MATHQFEIEGIRFELTNLSVDDSCAGLEVLAKALGPAIDQLGAAVAESDSAAGRVLVKSVLGNAGQAAALLKTFAPRAKVSRSKDGTHAGGSLMVGLGPEANAVFAGRVDLLLAFLFEAVQFEYAAFLSALTGGGGALADRLMAPPTP
jgi:hypothetical protein